MTATALVALALPLVGTTAAQDPSEVLCPIFIPESPAKWCIELTGNGCVVVNVNTEPTDVHRKTCPP